MRFPHPIAIILMMLCSPVAGVVGADAHESIFLNAVEVPVLPDEQAPVSLGSLAFDFSRSVELRYDFKQEIHSVFVLNQKQLTQDLSAAAKLIVQSDGMALGKITLRDITMSSPGRPANAPMPPLPPVIISEVRPDGTTTKPENPLGEAILLLLPVTGSDIKLGETSAKPRRFPISFQNQVSEAVGERKITAKRHVLYEGKACVLFIVRDTLEQLIPPIPDTTVDIRGDGYFLYDHQGKVIVISKLALRMRLLHKNETQIDSDNFFSIGR